MTREEKEKLMMAEEGGDGEGSNVLDTPSVQVEGQALDRGRGSACPDTGMAEDRGSDQSNRQT